MLSFIAREPRAVCVVAAGARTSKRARENEGERTTTPGGNGPSGLGSGGMGVEGLWWRSKEGGVEDAGTPDVTAGLPSESEGMSKSARGEQSCAVAG